MEEHKSMSKHWKRFIVLASIIGVIVLVYIFGNALMDTIRYLHGM